MKEKEVAHIVQEPRKSELVKACYGIVGAMFEVYKQLGPGMPEYIYQEALSKEIVGAQPGDVEQTYADASALERDFGFKPKTSLRMGLRRFVEWYKEFYC